MGYIGNKLLAHLIDLNLFLNIMLKLTICLPQSADSLLQLV